MASLVLPEQIASAADVRSLVLELQAYASWQSHAATKNEFGVAATGTTPVLSPAARHLLASQPNADALIEQLKHQTDHAETVTITLPAPPSGNLKQAMVAWCRQNIGNDTLVQFDFSSSLLGGMVVRRGSHIYDWSFRRQLLAAQPKLTEILRRG